MNTKQNDDQIFIDYFESKDIKIRDKIFMKYISLSEMIAGNIYPKYRDYYEWNEFLSFAHEGLLKTIMKFNPYLGCSWQTYSNQMIRNRIIDNIRQSNNRPRYSQVKEKEIKKLIDSGYTKDNILTMLNISEYVYNQVITKHIHVDINDYGKKIEDKRYNPVTVVTNKLNNELFLKLLKYFTKKDKEYIESKLYTNRIKREYIDLVKTVMIIETKELNNVLKNVGDNIIIEILNISYSTYYRWTHRLCKPTRNNLIKLKDFLKKNGII